LQDTRPFGLELFGEILIPFVCGDRHRERDQVDAPPDRLVDSAQRRLVVTGEKRTPASLAISTFCDFAASLFRPNYKLLS